MSTTPATFRAALARVVKERGEASIDAWGDGWVDGWVDDQLGISGLGEDGPGLPRGCVPYLPTSVTTLQRVIDRASIEASDTFVDIGSGLGRVTALVHLLTGARAIGLEIQPQLVQQSRDLASRLDVRGVTVIEGDAGDLVGQQSEATVFYLYAPFSGARLDRVLDALEELGRARPIRVCTLHVPALARPSLIPISLETDLCVYRSAR